MRPRTSSHLQDVDALPLNLEPLDLIPLPLLVELGVFLSEIANILKLHLLQVASLLFLFLDSLAKVLNLLIVLLGLLGSLDLLPLDLVVLFQMEDLFSLAIQLALGLLYFGLEFAEVLLEVGLNAKGKHLNLLVLLADLGVEEFKSLALLFKFDLLVFIINFLHVRTHPHFETLDLELELLVLLLDSQNLKTITKIKFILN